MTTMELEVKKASLARDILNIDNIEMLDELQKAYIRVKAQLSKTGEKVEPDSKEYVLAGIQQALAELKEVKAGRAKVRPARELLEELRAEEDNNR